MKQLIRKFIPKVILQIYHWKLAKLGAIIYAHPSRKMVVIGVTGTKGKSSVVSLISRFLIAAGYRVGAIATTHFRIGDKEWINETKQTMPGRFRLQHLLKKMVKDGCQYTVIETSSEGIAQYRHLGIDYDIAVFTNLSPEHIESHGSFEKYRDAKLSLFKGLQKSKRKHLFGKDINKTIVVNSDDKEAERFLSPEADSKLAFSLKIGSIRQGVKMVVGRNISLHTDHTSFTIENQEFHLNLLGEFNVYNALAALTVGISQGISLQVMKKFLEEKIQLPGRLEEVENNRGVRIFIDYAHEPASLEAVYKTVRDFRPRKIIGVLGSQGGGRDKAKRPLLGKLAAQYCDLIIVTNEDPYDEDPQQIISEVISGAVNGGKELNKNCWSILDRRAAIQKALLLSKTGDILIITGKGSETVMAVAGNKLIPWNDKKVIQELL